MKQPEDLRAVDNWLLEAKRQHPVMFELIFILLAGILLMLLGG